MARPGVLAPGHGVPLRKASGTIDAGFAGFPLIDKQASMVPRWRHACFVRHLQQYRASGSNGAILSGLR